MSLIFYEEGHKYQSLNGENIKWTSATTFIHQFTQPFEADKIIPKLIKKKGGKYYGLTVQQVKDIWEEEKNRSCEQGSSYHLSREVATLSANTLVYEGLTVPVIRPHIAEDGGKVAPPQKLENGIYPELLVYLKSAGICGQSDRVTVHNGVIDILDFKSNKEIKSKAFKNWEGKVQMMKPPLAHIEDCNLNHYNLQLSLYMYMILKQNPQLKPGKLTIEHVIFEKEGENQWGYPIYKLDENGVPIVKETVFYDLPYLKTEILDLIKWKKNHSK